MSFSKKLNGMNIACDTRQLCVDKQYMIHTYTKRKQQHPVHSVREEIFVRRAVADLDTPAAQPPGPRRTLRAFIS